LAIFIHSWDRGRPWSCDKRLLVLALVFACGCVLPALAHGDADWIMRNPEYVDQFGNRCYGPEDCERIPESFIREEGQEIHVLPTHQVFRKGTRGSYRSRDSSWWWCLVVVQEQAASWAYSSARRLHLLSVPWALTTVAAHFFCSGSFDRYHDKNRSLSDPLAT
jgi:hypothetical protein